MKLLLAEDSEELLEIMTELFQLVGYDVMIAETGLDAINLIRNDIPDVIVLDVNLPLASGFEVLKFLRQQDGGQDTKAIIFSGDTLAKDDPQVALADIFLDKPVDIQVLLNAVQSS